MRITTPAPQALPEVCPPKTPCCFNCGGTEHLAIGFSRWWAENGGVAPSLVVFCQPSRHSLLDDGWGCSGVQQEDLIWMPLDKVWDLRDTLERSGLRLTQRAQEDLEQLMEERKK